MSDIRIAVSGAAGHMGRELVRAIASAPGCVLSGGIEPSGSPHVGADLGTLAGLPPLNVHVTTDPLAIAASSDAVIDFTVPAATVEMAGLAANARIVHVIGTTGLNADDEAAIKAAARHATVIKAGNMSLGVNLLALITRRIAETLDADYDIEIVEMHHRRKVDAPSGTALMLGAAAAEGRGIDLETNSVRVRDGHTGPRKRGDIGFATLRGGTVVGDHTVVFAGDGERIEITHRAEDRSIFARGAVKAALWGRGKGPGLFNMGDVLGL
ncbi:MAG: 4-hydroxy-tetrahydrodipicolinate reductase [Hyphomicrobium sp.]|uniref:4-hydroxy-tetrahydrodipicolinate reductase n=1 Tax=Hyphomicrobium sp. TaxID=82 RepID=UPI003D0E5C01